MTLCDFAVKTYIYLTENRLSWNEMCCASDNHNYMCHTLQKNFEIRASIKQLLTKYQIFTILPQISHFQLLHPYKFYGRDMSGILFFIFASCEPLKLNPFIRKICDLVFHKSIQNVFQTISFNTSLVRWFSWNPCVFYWFIPSAWASICISCLATLDFIWLSWEKVANVFLKYF